MAVGTMTSKGQVTVPKEVRDELGLEAGTKLWFVRTPQGYVLRSAHNSVMALAGIVTYDGPSVTVEGMDAAVGEYLAQDDSRIRRDWRGGEPL
jgi:antitoxin PrlF